jgi:predicted dehydrogenase
MKTGKIRIGVIGAGGFGLFALQHFTQIPGVELVGMAGTHREAAFAVAQRFGIPDIEEVDALLERPDIDLVYIATPPFLHAAQGLRALQAGKHVICEKPLALNLADADEMIAVAQKGSLVLIANLMQRYNPMFDTIKTLIESRALGEFLHGYFENYASDEGLRAEHWFWDPNKSGGIFIEHGVHFFDLFEGWLGPGQVVSAQRTLRPGSGLEEQVQCAVRYGGGALVNFYHGFTQPNRLDRQEFRLLFERGDVVLSGWVPVQMRLRGVANEKGTRDLMEIFQQAQLNVTEVYGGGSRTAQGRHKVLDIYQKVEVRMGSQENKMLCYGDLLESALRDQLRWIYNPEHPRKLTHRNGRESLAMAVDATRMAMESR